MIALVTGAGRGIGAATAQIFAQNGYDVLLTSRSANELQDSSASIRRLAPKQKIEVFPADISKEEDVAQLFAFCLRTLGTPQVLVNNAGAIHVRKFIEETPAEWDRIQNINIRAVMLCCKQAFLCMKEKGGSIINVSSLAGIRSQTKFAGFAAYTASKSAVVGLSEALAVEGKEFNIRVNCIAPGAVNTRMLAQALPDLKSDAFPEDIAKTIFYFGHEPLSKHVTGSVLEVLTNA